MNKFFPLLLAASIPIAVATPKAGAQNKPAASSYRPYMTGERLVHDMKANPFEGANGIKRQRAMGYIEGVMDGFAGKQWCPAGKSIPHELNYDIVDEIARLGPARLNGDAATLLVAALAAHYPCARPGEKP